MRSLGHDVSWIEPSLVYATNDFLWSGVEYELKTISGDTELDYTHLRRPIAKEFRKARRKGQEPVKVNFVLDAGRRTVPQKVTAELAEINDEGGYIQMANLWILHSGGMLIEIPLNVRTRRTPHGERGATSSE